MHSTDTAITNNRLLITKLYVPSHPPVLVARQRLIQRLDDGLRVPLSLVCAPAGSGKTVLLASWLQEYREQADADLAVAWLSLGKEDNDPVRFWHYIVAALEMACPIPPLFTASLESTPAAPALAFITALLNDIAASSSTFVLVLDDYHVLHAPEIHEGMTFLLDHLPPNLHLFLASREEPPLPLARLRVRNQLVEVRLPDLRFTHDEATTFLQRMGPETLSQRAIAALEERTEGWIAGLQLAVLSMRSEQDAATFLATFTGDHRHVVDYLVEEVLNRLPERLQTFLLHTAVLERLCAALCNTITDQSDSQELLEYLEHANIFLVSLDEKRHWYRYHHLFAEVLLHRLQRLSPALPAELHLKASQWYENRGEIDTAIEHALLSSDVQHAAELIEQAGGECLMNGEITTLLRWIEALPEVIVRSRAKLCYFQMWTLIAGNRWQEAEEPLQAFEALRGSDVPFSEEKIASSVIAAHAALAMYKGDITDALALSQQALAATAPSDFVQRSYLLLYLSLAHWLNDDVASAEHVLLEICQPAMFAVYPYIVLSAYYNRLQLQRSRGRLHEMQATCQQAQELIERQRQKVPPSALSLVHMGNGELCYERNDLATADEHLTRCIALASHSDGGKFVSFAYERLALVKLALGDRDAANTLLEQAIQCNQFVSPPRHLARLAIRLGRIEEATRWTQHYTHDLEGKAVLAYWPDYVALAHLFLLEQHYDAALELLERLLCIAQAKGCAGCVMQALALQAVVQQTQGATGQALSLLARALLLAEPEGYMRTFLDEGTPIITLLVELARQKRLNSAYNVSLAYVQRLLAAAGIQLVGESNGVGKSMQSLPDQLSERELEILHLIAAGLSNQEITLHLVIAMSTLKTHINHIYSKLGVSSRTRAIVQARKMSLL